MRRAKYLLIAACAVSLIESALSVSHCSAEEPYVAFLKALRDAGYGEAAVDYIEQIQKRENLPVALREVIDLELAQSLLIAAEETEHRDIAEQRMALAKTTLEKFLKEHAEHAAAPAAFTSLADLETQRGQALLRQARVQKDNAAKAPLYAQARAAFEAAKPQYATSVERYQKRFTRLVVEKREGTTKKLNKRDEELLNEAELDWLEIRGKAALVDYHIAQTYPDPNDKARKAALLSAGKVLDEIYQRERSKVEGLTATGLYAHMWHGKVMDELGDLTTALDIYDEVLANAPSDEDRRASNSPLAPLFAQVEYFRLLILAKNKSFEEFIFEARDWLEHHKRSEKTNGYQGIAFEYAKALGARAESQKPEEAKKLKREASAILAKMVDVPSEFQQDAIVLRRLMGEKTGEIAKYSEAVALAQAAAESNQLNEAIDYYKQALELAKKEEKLPPEDLVKTRFRLANILWAANKLDEASQTAESIIIDNVDSPLAPSAATMAISAAKAKYFAETESTAKAEALKRLAKIADYTIQHWPDRAEADDARIALGQASMVRGELDAALKAFETVKAESDRYAQALHQAGQVNWQLYLQENRKLPAERDATRMAALRTKAEQQLVQSREAQRKTVKAGDPLPQALIDTELLLAEMSLDASKPDEAVKLLEPLLEANKAAGEGGLDRTKLRMFLAAVRAYVGMKTFDKATDVAAVLLASGDDIPVVNQVLVDFAKVVGVEYKRIQAQAIAADNADAQAKAAAAATAKSVQDLFTKVIEQLAARQNHSLNNKIYLAETCADIGSTAKARELFEAILKKATDEPGSVQQKAEIRIRAKLIGLLRNEKKYTEALPEVEKLITATGGRALEPLVEKGYILQSKAETTVPYDPKLYDTAISHWTSLRLKMTSMNPKPPEYYQLIYNTASCLMAQAENSKDKTKAVQVVQILNSVLQLNRHLLSPDMATKYDALVAKARKMQ